MSPHLGPVALRILASAADLLAPGPAYKSTGPATVTAELLQLQQKGVLHKKSLPGEQSLERGVGWLGHP